MCPIKPSVKIINSTYFKSELKIEVQVVAKEIISTWYDIRLSRMGYTLIYHGFQLTTPKANDEEVAQSLFRFLVMECQVACLCPTYRSFKKFYGIAHGWRWYRFTRRCAQLTERFFTKEEIKEMTLKNTV